MKQELFKMMDVTIREKGINILNRFFLNLFKEEVLGIFVYNSLEKKHLIEFLLGEVEVNSGNIYYLNNPISHKDYVDVARNKIVLVQSTSKLIENLTVADNIYIVCKKFMHILIDENAIIDKTQILFDRLGLDINPDKIANTLTNIEKIMVEIAKAYWLGAEAIIFKDLSSYFSDFELNQLVEIFGKIKRNGISVIMIDSFTNVFKQFSDRMYVMKNGSNVWTFENEEINDDVLSEYFYSSQNTISCSVHISNKTALKFENVTTKQLSSLSFEIRSGELLSVIDRRGSCIDEIYKILMGENIGYSGNIRVADKLFKTSGRWGSLNQGVAFIVENAIENMLFKDRAAIENLCFASVGKMGSIWVNSRYRESCIEDYEDFFIDDALNSITENLSLYEQQKLVFLKWHLYNPKVVVCLRPFSSIEAELRKVTCEMIDLLLKKGIGILILGSNCSELNNMGAEIIV